MKGPATFETLLCISNVFAKPETQQPALQYVKKKFKWQDLLDGKDVCFANDVD